MQTTVPCVANVTGEQEQGTAELTAESLIFRGDTDQVIRFSAVKAVTAKRGTLSVIFSDGQAEFELGPLAQSWATKIRYPRPLIDKLGVKPGQTIVLLNVQDPDFLHQLSNRTDKVWDSPTDEPADMIFLHVSDVEDLQELGALGERIKRDGTIWVLWQKGQQQIREDDIRNVALAVSLVDVKVVSFSDRLSALKLVIPKTLR